MAGESRYYWGVLYPECMIDDWETRIGDVLQLPYAYCVHDLDRDSQSEHRKDHIHLILAFGNTTTSKRALSVMQRLSAPGRRCINCVQDIVGIRNAYDYLIHDTEDCRKAGKYQYPPSDRKTGNGFDIGSYEQISQADKDAALRQLLDEIVDKRITNFADFWLIAMAEHPEPVYYQVIRNNPGLIGKIIDGCWQKYGGYQSDTTDNKSQSRTMAAAMDPALISQENKTGGNNHE